MLGIKNIRNLSIKLAIIAFIFMSLFTMQAFTHKSEAAGNRLAKKALSRVGSAYVRGAGHSSSAVKNKNQRSFDCSGLVNWSAYQSGKKIGINTTSSLGRVGHSASRKSLKAGDIMLFRCSGSRISHAAIYVGKGKLVHAPGRGRKVKVVSYNSYWKRRLAKVRRL